MTTTQAAERSPMTFAQRAKTSWRLAGIFVPFVLLYVILAIISAPFSSFQNNINILSQQASIICIAAAGTLVIVAGGIDLSVGAIYALGAVMTGKLALHHSPTVTVILVLLIGAGCGLANGVIIAIFKINALIGTLAMSFVIGGLALWVSADNLIVLTPTSPFRGFANHLFFKVPSSIWIAGLVVVLLTLTLTRTVFGRYVIAAGGNAQAAHLAGIRVSQTRVITYILSGGMAALGAAIDTSRLLSADASVGGNELAFTVLAAIVVGGTSIAGGQGSVPRTVIGALFIALIGNGFILEGINPIYQNIVLGLILLIAVGLDVLMRRRSS